MAKPDIERMIGFVQTASKLKTVMKRKGIRKARCACPHCEGGIIRATLNGHRDHIWAKCSTPNCLVMME